MLYISCQRAVPMQRCLFFITSPVIPVATKYRLVREAVHGIDRLSFGHCAAALAHVVTQMEKPVVIGIFAPWGSGKVKAPCTYMSCLVWALEFGLAAQSSLHGQKRCWGRHTLHLVDPKRSQLRQKLFKCSFQHSIQHKASTSSHRRLGQHGYETSSQCSRFCNSAHICQSFLLREIKSCLKETGDMKTDVWTLLRNTRSVLEVA